MKKVFCSKCKFVYLLTWRETYCISPENTEERYPSEINSTNQCPWYKERQDENP